jgi:signal transduction histidine kinase
VAQDGVRALERLADDLRAVGGYVDILKSDVAQTRTRLAESRDRLAAAEKLAAVGKLAASVAHEVRNPLTALKIRLFTIGRSLEGNPRYQADLDVASEEIARLDGIVRSFLEYARPPKLRLERCSLRPTVEDTLELMKHRFRQRCVRVEYESAAGEEEALVDADQMKQVLINLLENAVEAIGAEGVVRLHSSVEDGRDGHRMLVLRVTDTGQGITDEARPRIFEPFYSSRLEGTGLGLCIANSIIVRHGGSLELESTSERGTTFAVRIPVAGDENGHGADR